MLDLPPASENEISAVFSRISAPVLKSIEPVGRWYEAYITRRHHNSSSHHSFASVSDDSSSSDESISSDDEDDSNFVLTLDPKEWKDQDHYRVMGLTKLRHSASEAQVKKAFKKKVLKYHPDKKKSRENSTNQVAPTNDDFFSCITKANEILSNRKKRRAYDSVDSTFDDDVPSINQNNKANFYEVFGPVIERNARWSNNEPVPLLGHENSTFEEVDKFYSSWYDSDSWREFSYLDEEEKEKGENRDERRWIEKQNKVMRQKRKKEEVARMRTLIDNTYACDPRIKKFKDEEKERKLAEKKAKEDAVKAAAEEKMKKIQEQQEAERLAKEQEEQEAKIKAVAAKKEKEKLKTAMKKERKSIRIICKNYNYFFEDESLRLEHMDTLDRLLESLSLDHLKTFREDVEKGETRDQVFAVYQQQVEDWNERKRQEEQNQKVSLARSKKENEQREEKDSKWTLDQSQLLVKAVNLFPAGTVSRWRVIADYINDHSKDGQPREPKHVIKKVKSLQKSDVSLKEECNRKAFSKFDLSHTLGKSSSESVPTVRYDVDSKEQTVAASWSSNEQKLLEEALRKYPGTTPERWERIAESIPNRTKKECMKRYKELVEMIKAKKAASQAKATK